MVAPQDRHGDENRDDDEDPHKQYDERYRLWHNGLPMRRRASVHIKLLTSLSVNDGHQAIQHKNTATTLVAVFLFQPPVVRVLLRPLPIRLQRCLLAQ